MDAWDPIDKLKALMKFVVVMGLLLVGVRPATADDARTCKASADCGANAACTAEGKCVQLAPTPAPPPTPATPGPSDADIATAKAAFEQGVVLFNDNNFSSALAKFTESYRLNPQPFVLINIGSTQQRLSLYVEAIETLEKYLALVPDAPNVEDVRRSIKEIRDLLVEAKFAITPDKGVTITIDGHDVGTTPLTKPLLIPAGSRTIEFKAAGYETERRSLMVANGVALDLKIALKEIPTLGKVRITSVVPRAIVTIDGQARGPVPIEVELKGGGHTLELIAPDYQPYRGELVVTPGQTREVPIALDKVVVMKTTKPWYKKWYVVAPIGAVVVGGGVGAYLATRPPDPIVGTLAPGSGALK
jgi:hypothetical protein